MKKNIAMVIAAFTLMAISSISLAENRGACYIQIVFQEPHPKKEQTCHEGLTYSECQNTLKVLEERYQRDKGKYGLPENLRVLGKWKENQNCSRFFS